MIDIMLQHVHECTGADRTLILRADRNKRPVRVWIEHEQLGALPSVKADWQGKPANGRYGRLLDDCSRYGRVDLVTARMREGVLKGVYESSGVEHSIVVSLGHQSIESYRYLSVNFLRRFDAAEPHREFLESAKRALSRMISHADLR